MKEYAMKKIIALLSVAIFTIAIVAFAAEDTKPELRPAQKLMQARAAWLASMSKNLEADSFKAIAKDADELAAQTQRVGESHPNPLGKELTLAISSFAKDVSAAAAKQDGETVKGKLGEIKGKCGECHAKIRDKK
jgi:cytochrome c556